MNRTSNPTPLRVRFTLEARRLLEVLAATRRTHRAGGDQRNPRIDHRRVDVFGQTLRCWDRDWLAGRAATRPRHAIRRQVKSEVIDQALALTLGQRRDGVTSAELPYQA